MCLNKKYHLFLKIIAVAGMYFWGALAVILVMEFFLELAVGIDQGFHNVFTLYEIKMYVICTPVIILLYAAHLWLNKRLANATIYNSLFANDPDGVIQFQVLSKAMGKDESVIKKDIFWLREKKILKNFRIQQVDNTYNIVLFNGKDSELASSREKKVVCRSCGGKTTVRMGYVKSCPYCGSELNA